jgi:hypothetical protein
MLDEANPRAVAGGNNPPDPLIVEADERIDTANKWLTERKEIADAEQADKANFFLSQIDATFKALDRRRIDEKNAFLAEQDKVYKTPLSLLERAKKALGDMRRAWLKKEEDRLAEEKRQAEAAAEAARKAAAEAAARAEAEAKKKGGDVLRAQHAAEEAAAKAEEVAAQAEAVPEKAQIKGAYSAKATGLRDVWSAEVTDLSLAFKHYNAKSNPNRTILAAAIEEAITGIANAEAKRIKDVDAAPPGIKFIKERK